MEGGSGKGHDGVTAARSKGGSRSREMAVGCKATQKISVFSGKRAAGKGSCSLLTALYCRLFIYRMS